MESSVLSSLSLVFIAAGLVLLVTSLHLNRRAHAWRLRLRSLLRLSVGKLEPLELPAAAWPELSGSGWCCLQWQGSWFGQPVSGQMGVLPEKHPSRGTPLVFDIRSGEDVQLQLVWTHAVPGGETRMFAELLARIFVLLFETRLRARTEALSAAMAERAHLSLYLQHDMRNLAQWVDWVSTDFSACTTPEALLAAAGRLRDNAPLAQERARRLFDALGQRSAGDKAEWTDLRPVILQAARMCGLEPRIEGEAGAWVARDLLTRALDNLFGNLAAVWREHLAVQPALRLCVSSATGRAAVSEVSELHFHSPWPDDLPPLSAEKIFEPFASGRPGGLGLGLYQARKSLREAGGDLLADPGPDGIDFVLRLPAQPPEA